MNMQMVWEIIGYVGSLLVVISLVMSNIIKLRIINTIGSTIFCVYALIIKSYPTAIMNAVLVGINIYYLVKLLKTQKSYYMLEIDTKDKSLEFFLQSNKEDILKYFDWVETDTLKYAKAYTLYDNMTLAGLFLAEENDGELNVKYDYTTPQYRDKTVGKYVYRTLKELGYKSVVYEGDNTEHINYILSEGFTKNDNKYIKAL